MLLGTLNGSVVSLAVDNVTLSSGTTTVRSAVRLCQLEQVRATVLSNAERRSGLFSQTSIMSVLARVLVLSVCALAHGSLDQTYPSTDPNNTGQLLRIRGFHTPHGAIVDHSSD